jgi:hypothetical protein
MKHITTLGIIACTLIINNSTFGMLKQYHNRIQTKKIVIQKRHYNKYQDDYPNHIAFNLFNKNLELEREKSVLEVENKTLCAIINKQNETLIEQQEKIRIYLLFNRD